MEAHRATDSPMKRWIAAIVGCIAIAAATRFVAGVFPECPFRWATHLHCPGCGGTRAFHALIHGDWSLALHFNALVCVFGAALCGYAAWALSRSLRLRRLCLPGLPRYTSALLLALTMLFTIGRNLVMIPRF